MHTYTGVIVIVNISVIRLEEEPVTLRGHCIVLSVYDVAVLLSVNLSVSRAILEILISIVSPVSCQ